MKRETPGANQDYLPVTSGLETPRIFSLRGHPPSFARRLPRSLLPRPRSLLPRSLLSLLLLGATAPLCREAADNTTSCKLISVLGV